MFIARIDVGFGSDGHQPIEVMNIHMDEHPEQSSQYLLTNRYEILREWNVWKERKD